MTCITLAVCREKLVTATYICVHVKMYIKAGCVCGEQYFDHFDKISTQFSLS